MTRYPHQLAAHPHAFCNRACFGAWYSTHRRVDRPTVTCQTCGATFERLASRDKWTGGKHFCSRACAVAARSGENHHRWGGGRQKRPDGYVDISRALVPEAFRSMVRKDGRMMEHRLVMAQHLGRPLEDWEVVHHVDGQRDRNVIGNLELHPEHDHNGITAMTQRDRQIAALRAQIADLQGRIRELDPPP